MKTEIVGVRAFSDIEPGLAIRVAWEDDQRGFGLIDITQYEETMVIDSEYMSREFVKNALCQLVDDAVFVHERENK